MANTGQISCNGDLDTSFPAYKDCKWLFDWTSTQTNPGKTKITYNIYPRADDNGHSLAGYLEVYIDGTQIKTIPNDVYAFGENSTSKASGSFTITHNNEGEGSFEVTLKGRVYSGSGSQIRGTVIKTFDLDENMPYESCYWDTNATVSIDETLQKPDSNITIRWSGAKAGTANEIVGFEVYYSLNSGTSWTAVSTSIAKTATSTTMKVPSNRGSTITAKVVIKNTQTSFTNPSKTGGSCKINSLPDAPTVLTDSTIIPSTQSTISFTVTAGTDADKQACSIKYATSSTGTKTDYTSGTNIDIDKSTTYYFWTWDGYEWGSSTQITITKNTKPTVTLTATGEKLKCTLEATKGEDGQSSNNSYRYGFKYNNTEYYLTSGFINQLSCEVGDIRHWISKENDGLFQDTTYLYQYWVQRYDGIEYSEKYLLNSESFHFHTKVLTLDPGINSNDNLAADLAGYFGTNIKVEVTGQGDDGYYPTGSRSFSSIKRGEQLTSIDFKKDENSSQSFNIKISPLTRVYAFDFSNIIINSSDPFKPYSQSHMSVTMAGRDATYGFSKVPQIKCGNSSINGTVSATDNQWNYLLPPNVVWTTIINGRANDATATYHKNLTVTNEFGEEFTQRNVKFYFDFREAPIFNNFSMFEEDTAYIKEDVELTLKGTITYYNKIININIRDNGGNHTYTAEKENSSYLGNPWRYNSDTGAWMCTGYTYDLSSIKNKQPVVTKQYQTTFTVSATCVNKTSSVTTSSITVIRHTPPRIRFTELKYSPKTLSGYYIIDDLGYDSGWPGQITDIYMLGPDTDKEGKEITYTIWSRNENNLDDQPELGVEEEFEIDYPNFTENFRELYPMCQNKLGRSTKTTENFEYLVVYNVLPTIAYRQNHLGINTKDPSSAGNNRYLPNPTLTIGAYNQHKFIYLTSTDKIASINLETSGLNGFVIDAGSWDEMDSIDVTYEPQDLQIIGLAPIAYTGEVGDLEQERSDTIIITGGSSTV